MLKTRKQRAAACILFKSNPKIEMKRMQKKTKEKKEAAAN